MPSTSPAGRLNGAVEFTFKSGTVIPSNSVALCLAGRHRLPRPHDRAARRAGPVRAWATTRGNLSARGEVVQISMTTRGRGVRPTPIRANPSPAQQYLRITEIMYHPVPAARHFHRCAELRIHRAEEHRRRRAEPGRRPLRPTASTSTFSGSAVTSLGAGRIRGLGRRTWPPSPRATAAASSSPANTTGVAGQRRANLRLMTPTARRSSTSTTTTPGIPSPTGWASPWSS